MVWLVHLPSLGFPQHLVFASVVVGAVLAATVTDIRLFLIVLAASLSLLLAFVFGFVNREDSFALHAFPTSDIDKESQNLQRQGMILYEREWKHPMSFRGDAKEIMLVLVCKRKERRVVGIATVADVSTSLDTMRRMLTVGIPRAAVLQRMISTLDFVGTIEDAEKLLSDDDDTVAVEGDNMERHKVDSGDQNPAGGIIKTKSSAKTMTEAYFGNLVIHPDFRGRGLGKAMTRAAVLCARDVLAVDRLHGSPATSSLVGFYQRLGAFIQRSESQRRKDWKVKTSSKQLVAPRLSDMDMGAIRRELVARGIEIKF